MADNDEPPRRRHFHEAITEADTSHGRGRVATPFFAALRRFILSFMSAAAATFSRLFSFASCCFRASFFFAIDVFRFSYDFAAMLRRAFRRFRLPPYAAAFLSAATRFSLLRFRFFRLLRDTSCFYADLMFRFRYFSAFAAAI